MKLKIFKLLLTPNDDSTGNVEAARSWARSLSATPGTRRVEFDPIETEGQEVHDRATDHDDRKPDWSVVVSLWGSEKPQTPPPGYAMRVVTVDDRVGYGFEGDREGPVDGYKKMSFWKAKAGLTRAEWDPLYASHIITVPHLQPIWRYRQNMIVDKPWGFPFDAISENWWLTLHDLNEGFFFSEEAKQRVFAEVSQFIDFVVTINFVCRNEVLFIA